MKLFTWHTESNNNSGNFISRLHQCEMIAVSRLLKNVKVSSLSRMATALPLSTYKTSTGLVGLSVDPNGRETLRSLAAQVLTNVKVSPVPPCYTQSMRLGG